MKTPDYPALQIMKLADLKPADYNPRTITAESIGRLTKSMAELGNLQPIVYNVRTKTLIGGHQRLKVMLSRGDKETQVWCVDLDPKKEKAANVALNNLVGEWDRAGLETLISELRETDLDLDITGLGSDGLDDLILQLRKKAEADERDWTVVDAGGQIDRATDLAKEWKTKTGQVWALGEHRLACGDAQDSAVWARLMGGEVGHLMWTDPPYGVNYDEIVDARRSHGCGNARKSSTVGAADLGLEQIIPVLAAAFAQFNQWSHPGSPVYVAFNGQYSRHLLGLFDDSKWKLSRILVWVKSQLVPGLSDYHYRHELVFYGWRTGKGHPWYGGRTQDSIFEIKRPLKSSEHPTMKPVELIVPMIENSSRAGEVVLEPFSGSGSTILACETVGRRCRAIEIDPRYVAVALQRYQDATGKEPELINVRNLQPAAAA